MRGKLSKEVHGKAQELERVRAELDRAVDQDDDELALALISRRDALDAEVDRLASELRELTAEAELAKQNLMAFQNEIVRLRDEKVHMLARLANAKARLRLQETLHGMSPDADIRALESVRDHINRLVAEVQVSREVGDPDLEKRLRAIRKTEASAAKRAQLDELKRTRQRKLLPLPLARSAAAIG
jgi:phage shock protein A